MNSIGNLMPLGHYSTLEVIDHDLFVEIEVSVSCCGSFIDVEELATRIEGVLTTEVTINTEVVLTLVNGHY